MSIPVQQSPLPSGERDRVRGFSGDEDGSPCGAPSPQPSPQRGEGATASPPHPLAEFWHHFRRNTGAVAGLVVIVVLALLALFADVVAPHSPIAQYRDTILVP
ncbi:MAG TPA: hypothetical protein VGE72_19570, partial [Azospirillum sp.]